MACHTQTNTLKGEIQQSKTALNHTLNTDTRNNPAPDCDPGLRFYQD